MSKKRYEAIETYALDTWAFITFFAVCGAVAYYNTLFL